LIETSRTIDAYCLECDLVWPISAQERVAVAEAVVVSPHNLPVSEKAPRLNASMYNWIPVVVRLHVECARCGHTEDESCEFDVPLDKSRPVEKYGSGTCPKCAAPILMHLKRTLQQQCVADPAR